LFVNSGARGSSCNETPRTPAMRARSPSAAASPADSGPSPLIAHERSLIARERERDARRRTQRRRTPPRRARIRRPASMAAATSAGQWSPARAAAVELAVICDHSRPACAISASLTARSALVLERAAARDQPRRSADRQTALGLGRPKTAPAPTAHRSSTG
jgi:hypothetical protein